ncbi:hypothetical protein HCJ52_04210 [Listeria sp. FSL L7-1485]|uniref:DUF4870 domain-containing protein n=1 Tax=Listeria immobilis TaxID=2713502 RepID=A0A7X1C804_9LIST|nr:hypothetical protein [Listeria immobilis]MBC1482098.1 hypothetical protein [Listeria immobilis]MBC1487773.1 hypothetical protein [Listeria immobilis]MBC1505489.1 hypothetical protein [Listeria immobilis]MBC1509078.1 hypothetical protein [Listeria immobilis]MBC1514639.1 hypothetical protein [Listeria immobilis]
MLNKKIMYALCYFSIFFSPIITPGILLFSIKGKEMKHHAKWALLTHTTFVIGMIVTFLLYNYVSFSTNSSDTVPFLSLASVFFIVVLNVTILLFNLIRGITCIVKHSEDNWASC